MTKSEIGDRFRNSCRTSSPYPTLATVDAASTESEFNLVCAAHRESVPGSAGYSWWLYTAEGPIRTIVCDIEQVFYLAQKLKHSDPRARHTRPKSFSSAPFGFAPRPELRTHPCEGGCSTGVQKEHRTPSQCTYHLHHSHLRARNKNDHVHSSTRLELLRRNPGQATRKRGRTEKKGTGQRDCCRQAQMRVRDVASRTDSHEQYQRSCQAGQACVRWRCARRFHLQTSLTHPAPPVATNRPERSRP